MGQLKIDLYDYMDESLFDDLMDRYGYYDWLKSIDEKIESMNVLSSHQETFMSMARMIISQQSRINALEKSNTKQTELIALIVEGKVKKVTRDGNNYDFSD
ncbi:hypothetical protein [Solemya elarraichensis gill symbiont]|uniref:Uncharacterized protein n=1 Tax=Solemya elarraichensis gill symbiont TaxID=1918949 RepID=A0A1T2KWR1_9GAMM|nr:hypothetical protein [Solemya elarraichensis gill symbiont]OOZ37186.1 hypothetical protein BOW52_10345 [Solemya elarraichensis gill symbiont]